jgi:hypothetical protein
MKPDENHEILHHFNQSLKSLLDPLACVVCLCLSVSLCLALSLLLFRSFSLCALSFSLPPHLRALTHTHFKHTLSICAAEEVEGDEGSIGKHQDAALFSDF